MTTHDPELTIPSLSCVVTGLEYLGHGTNFSRLFAYISKNAKKLGKNTPS